jgi:hypothetical protein
VTSIVKDESANSAVFAFRLSPALMALNNRDISSNTSLICSAEYVVTEYSYVFGTLKLSVDYSTSLEGL